MSYKMYRTEMLYIHFTWHRLIPERLFLPLRGPVYPGFAQMFCLLLCVLVPCVTVFVWCCCCVLRVSRCRVSGPGRVLLCVVCLRCIAVAGFVWSYGSGLVWSRGVITVNPWYYYRITLILITMEEHDIDALIDMTYGDDHLYGSDE